MRSLNNQGLVLAVAGLLSSCASLDETTGGFDVVLLGGRVMDPESGFDAVRNVGIRDGRIEAISTEVLSGEREIDAEGLVVAPGFIDLHVHGQTHESFSYMVRDGVTSAFELEVGTGDVAGWYAQREGGQLANYGVSIGHIPVRMIVKGDPGEFLPSGPANNEPATEEEIEEMARRLDEGLARGAVAVGFGLAYTPAASPEEVDRMLRVVADHGTTAHIHVREVSKGSPKRSTRQPGRAPPCTWCTPTRAGGPRSPSSSPESSKLVVPVRT